MTRFIRRNTDGTVVAPTPLVKRIRVFSPRWPVRPGKWVDSPHLIAIIFFFDNFLIIIYLLVVCKKNNNSFILVYFCQRSQAKLFLQNLQKKHTRTVKSFFFVPTQKCMKWLRCCTSAQITSFLMNYASNAKILIVIRCQTKSEAIHNIKHVKKAC